MEMVHAETFLIMCDLESFPDVHVASLRWLKRVSSFTARSSGTKRSFAKQELTGLMYRQMSGRAGRSGAQLGLPAGGVAMKRSMKR